MLFKTIPILLFYWRRGYLGDPSPLSDWVPGSIRGLGLVDPLSTLVIGESLHTRLANSARARKHKPQTIETLVLSPLYYTKGVFDVFYSGREGVTRVEQLILLIGWVNKILRGQSKSKKKLKSPENVIISL